jgi:hypothetical protein
MQLKLQILTLIIGLLNFSVVLSQAGINSKIFEFSDSTKAKNSFKWLKLNEWNNYK